MAFLPKRLQSKFDSKLYDSKPQLNPTETLDAIEQALQTVLSRYGNERHFGSGRQADEINKEHTVKLGFETLAHLATLRQQVADLVAFREAHEWRPTPDGSTKNGDRGIVGIWSNILNDWLYISDAVYCWDSEITKLAWRDSEGEALESDLSAGRVTFYMPLTPPAAEGGQGGG